MSDFKYEVELTQHTPIIHFQYEQNGATLRVSELKPKLDKYLLKVDKNLDFKKHANGKISLEYSVKVIASQNQIIEFEKYPPLYFGNQRGSKPKQKVISNNIKVKFFSFDKNLIETIKKHFEAFLAQTNFGTRQSKGYGCFYLKNKEFNPSLIDSKENTKVYSFTCSKQYYENDIKNFYTLIRSGINRVGRNGQNMFYVKSLMFLYSEKQEMIWDKKAIKMHFLDRISDTKNQYIIRDLLGLSTFQNWRSYKFNVKKSNPKISRFKSPITFKPIAKGDKVTVYFWSKKFNPTHKMLNEAFNIFGRGSFTIKTPKKFDMEEFLGFVKDTNINELVETKYKSTNDFKSLNKIFNSLKVYS